MSELVKLLAMTEHTHCDNMVNQLRIEVRLPEGHWSGDVSRSRPEAILRIEETMPLGRGRGTARLSSSTDLISELENHPGVDEVRDLGDHRYEVDIDDCIEQAMEIKKIISSGKYDGPLPLKKWWTYG